MSYSHLNVYDGRDVKRGGTTTGWVVQALEHMLPEPTISLTCRRKGHEWTAPVTPLSPFAEVRGCKRCAKRGLLVLETRQVQNTESERP